MMKRFVPAPIKRRVRAVRRARRRFGSLSYDGRCTVCGAHDVFITAKDEKFAARSFPCPSCRSALRHRNEAAAIVDEFARGRHVSIAEMIESGAFSDLAIYNTGVSGPVRARLSECPKYVESTYWDDAVAGEERDGVQHQDLHALSFGDASFDLATSSHVMEHVADPKLAFRELYRVLRPGGRLIFSVPMSWPPRRLSVQRAHLVDGVVEHLLAPMYHDSPSNEPSLVFTDFGTDLLDMLSSNGFIARQQRPNSSLELAFRDSVFVGIKPY